MSICHSQTSKILNRSPVYPTIFQERTVQQHNNLPPAQALLTPTVIGYLKYLGKYLYVGILKYDQSPVRNLCHFKLGKIPPDLQRHGRDVLALPGECTRCDNKPPSVGVSVVYTVC